jgi:hypothetical protein
MGLDLMVEVLELSLSFELLLGAYGAYMTFKLL